MLQPQKLVVDSKKLNTWNMPQVPLKLISGSTFLGVEHKSRFFKDRGMRI
jgi:hypothetical protein